MPQDTFPKWNDIAQHLDPMMPKQDYDQVREKYWTDVLRSRIPRGQDLDAVKKEYLKRTERTPLLSPTDLKLQQLKLGTTSALRELLPGATAAGMVRGGLPALGKAQQVLDRSDEKTRRLIEREGGSTRIPEVAGALVGGLPATLAMFTGLEAASAPLVGNIANVLSLGKKAKVLLNNGLAFSAYDALHAKTGDKFTAGAVGFGEGLAWTLPIIPFLKEAGFAKTTEEAEKLLTRSMQEPEKVAPEVQTAIAKKLQEGSKITQTQELLPNGILRDPKTRGVRVRMIPPEGQPLNIEVRPGRESEALNLIRRAQAKGASFDGIQFHPDDQARAFKFLREGRDSEAWKYEDPMILQVQKGMAENVAKRGKEEGIPTNVVDPEHVEVHAKRQEVEELPHEKDAREAKQEGPPEPKMTLEKAREIAQRYGSDPDKTDLEAIRNTGEAEIERLMSVRDRARAVKPEFDPTGKGPGVSAVTDFAKKYKETFPEAEAEREHFGKPGSMQGAFLTAEGELLHSGEHEHSASLKEAGMLSGNIYNIETEHEAFDLLKKEGVARVNFYRTREAGRRDSITVAFENTPTSDQLWQMGELKKKYPRASIEYSTPGVGGFRVFTSDMMSSATTLGDILKSVPGAEGGDALKFGPRRKVDTVQVGEALSDALRRNGIGQVITPLMKMSFHPFRTSIEVTPEAMFTLSPGAKALTYHNFMEASVRLGMRTPRSVNEMFPAVVFTKATGAEEKFHEFLHAAQVKAGYIDSMHEVIPPTSRIHAYAIARKLGAVSVYSDTNFRGLLAEAYAYAATAVRYGGTEYGQGWLKTLTEWDGSEKDVKDLVCQTSEKMLAGSQGKLDTPSERILQRKLSDLMRRSDPNVSYNIHTVGESARWNPEALNWQVREGDTVHNLKSIHDVWDHLLSNDISDLGPNFSQELEISGIRGPMAVVAPRGNSPGLPTVGIQPEERWVGASGASAWFRPFLPWVSTIDSKLNRAIRKRGESFPIFDAVKKVDSQLMLGDKWLRASRDSFVDLMKGTPSKRLFDYFNVLTYRPKDFGEAAAKYGLEPKELEKVRGLEDWMTKYRAETGLDPFQYLRDIYPRLHGYNFAPEAVWSAKYDPKSAGRWEKAVREEGFDPRDNHIGRFAGYLLQQGFEKKFTGQALKDLQKLVDYRLGGKADADYFLHKGLKAPLDSYVKYVKGVPDQTQVVLNRAAKDFLGKVQQGIAKVNTHLPAGFQIPGSHADVSPKLFQRFMALSYAATLGLRPAIGVRDSLQVLLTSLPVMGGKKFARGLELMFSKEARGIADEAGAFLSKTNIGDVYGDVFGEVPSGGRIAQGVDSLVSKMMSPSRWGHNFSRGITFLGEYDGALRSIKQLQAGRMSMEDFLHETSLWFMDEQPRTKLLAEAMKSSNHAEVAKKIALETLDLTQWPYRRGTQASVLRTGIGRIFGQFGVWPSNYADFLRRLGGKTLEGGFRTPALRTAGLWFATNYAVTSAMEGLGADVSKWNFISPAGYELGPHAQLVKDLMASPEETDEGRAARKRVLEYPLNFVPARVELENILNVMESKPHIGTVKGALDPDVLQLLGFKPKKEMPQLGPEDLAKYELGFKGTRTPIGR